MRKVSSYYSAPGPKSTGWTVITEAIVIYVCNYYDTDLQTIKSQNRKRDLSFVRHLLMYLLRYKAKLQQKEIAEIVDRERTDVVRGIKSIQNYIDTDSLNKRSEILMHVNMLGDVA